MTQMLRNTLIPSFRNFTLAVALFFIAYQPAYAQPPVLAGLKLRLEAATGFNPNGSLPATWTDLSLSGNNLTAVTDATEPSFVSAVPGTSFAGVYFSGDNKYMQNAVLNSTFSDTAATLFLVRVANTALSITPHSHTLLSISDDGNFHDEFCMNSDIAMHHTWRGNFQYRDHQCFSALPNDSPVVLTGVFGKAVSDINYYVNNIQSTNALSPVAGFPTPYSFLNRRIYVGTRLQSGNPQEFFEGYLLEVLAYNRKLTIAEIDSVNNYLRCKYSVRYISCNASPMPQCSNDTTNHTGILRFEKGEIANTLFQNTPNPFYTSTEIQFNIGNIEKHAELVITDFTGKKIKSFLIDHTGYGSVTLDAASFPAGSYLYSLIVDGQYLAHKKMMLIK